MKKSTLKIIGFTVSAIILLQLIVFGCLYYLYKQSRTFAPYTPTEEAKIYLYTSIPDKKADSRKLDEGHYRIWKSHYDRGVRHLFFEISYATAQLLNMWMNEKDDSLISQWSEDFVYLFKRIKATCPETVFHGVDLGWRAYDDHAEQYLKYLENSGQKNSEEYEIAAQNIEEGKKWWKHPADLRYREDLMAQYFMKAYENISQEKVVGFFAAAHCRIKNNILDRLNDNMALRLKSKYGDVISVQFIEALDHHRGDGVWYRA